MKVYVVMGVSGIGKTTIGKSLADKLEIPFYDADDYHPDANVEKMSKGMALNDEDRKGWLQILAKNIKAWSTEKGAVLACSALKECYRETLTEGLKKQVVFVYLHAEYDLVYKRMKARKGHYFKAELLKSQFDILEEPKDAIKVNANQGIPEMVHEVLAKINPS
ncbi:MAG: gluconate kinase [Zunongwangia sp.]|uniref:Gluconokinase n=1 Tax=Zunongwangia profunda TaxID=398743 RepID=A0A3D5IY05_9FLAO|nr:gluconokinase [Zunongwangia profunda]MAO36437.1 gluconate kinase [Zunongwangia sp.]MAS72760.1 gluconate kinase [Zunongwangia sp.]HCV80765.1 gluconate kinase [Zunongwangia profunda]|tara:strand:- start:2459 stop:2950 length:492 start_codon:yes stop_codon:yes gene_type:complete